MPIKQAWLNRSLEPHAITKLSERFVHLSLDLMRGARLVSPRRAVKGLYPSTYNPTFYSAVQSSLRRSSNEDVPISRRLIEALDRQPTSNTTRPHIPTSVGHKRSKGKGSNSHKNSRATTWSPHGSWVGIFWDMGLLTFHVSLETDLIHILGRKCHYKLV